MTVMSGEVSGKDIDATHRFLYLARRWLTSMILLPLIEWV